MGEAPLYSLIQKEAISSRSTKRSGVPLKRGSGSLEVLFLPSFHQDGEALLEAGEVLPSG